QEGKQNLSETSKTKNEKNSDASEHQTSTNQTRQKKYFTHKTVSVREKMKTRGTRFQTEHDKGRKEDRYTSSQQQTARKLFQDSSKKQ
ncbi:hypothetical protein M569_13763, partial [Genlisea aurea]